MSVVIRLVLLVLALIVCGWIIAAHGVRGVVLLVIIGLLVSVPQTRGWKYAERWLVKLTGSRQRAAALVLGIVILILAAVNLLPLVH